MKPFKSLIIGLFILGILILANNVRAQSTIPIIMATNPVDGDVGVPPNINMIELDFDRPIVTYFWEDNLGLRTNDRYETNRIINFRQYGNASYVILDGANLSANTEYFLDVKNLQDSSGNIMENYTLSFTTENPAANPVPAPAANSIVWIAVVRFLLLAGIITASAVLWSRRGSDRTAKNNLQGLLNGMDNAIALRDIAKVTEIYGSVQSAFSNLLPEEKKKYYGEIVKRFNQLAELGKS